MFSHPSLFVQTFKERLSINLYHQDFTPFYFLTPFLFPNLLQSSVEKQRFHEIVHFPNWQLTVDSWQLGWRDVNSWRLTYKLTEIHVEKQRVSMIYLTSIFVNLHVNLRQYTSRMATVNWPKPLCGIETCQQTKVSVANMLLEGVLGRQIKVQGVLTCERVNITFFCVRWFGECL